MSNEYDYNHNGQQSAGVPENTASQQMEQNWQNGAQDSGAYRYSGSSIPGQNGGYQGGVSFDNSNRTQQTGNAYGSQQTENPYGAQHTGANYGQNTSSYQNAGYTYQNGAYQYQQPQSGYSHTNQNAYGAQNTASNPMSGYNVKPTHTKKKSSVGKGVIAAALVCALIGGIGGGTAVGMALRGNSTEEAAAAVETTPTAAEEESTIETTTLEIGSDDANGNNNINTTVLEVTTNSETTEMTPKDVYEQYVNAVVAVYNESTVNFYGQTATSTASGSGFIISEDGYIITNNHVVSGAETLTVIMTSGEEYEAQLIGTDAENDVALIKIDATDLPTVSIGDSDDIEVGEQVAAIGNPLGELTNTLTVGYVSALDREINENGTPISMFQTDCVINSGNSGGPIFDMHGNVIGITTAKYSSSGSSTSASIEGIGFCIPINDAMDIVSDLLEYGYVTGRPSLGITCQVVSSTITQYYNLPTGVTVVSVEEGTAAEKAGLEAGDIITAVDGTEVSSITEFRTLLKQYRAGDTATLTVYRSSTAQTMEMSVTFDEKTTAASAQQTVPSTAG